MIQASNAQIDTIYELRQVQVTAQRIDLSDIGKHSDHLDSNVISLHKQDNLATLLSANTPLFIRAYGPGTLATLGIRGGGATHTQILWNGIPLRNPMIGLVDLSLIPVAFIDDASIHYGGHGAAFGSGAIGGLISIDNQKISFKNSAEVIITAGSWNNRSGQLKLNYGIKPIRFTTRLFAQNALNDFRYRLSKISAEKRQVHHHLINRGLLQEVFIPINEKHLFSGRLWYQYADRQLPPTSTQSNSKAAQQDKNLRTSLQWDYNGNKIQWQLKSAWLDETIDYQDTLILLYTHNQFKTWLAEASTSFRITPSVHFTGGVYTEIAKGESANYNEHHERRHSAIFTSVRLLSKNMVWRLQAREEITSNVWSPLLVDFSNEWSMTDHFTIKASVSRNYRMPTLNDLYWRPGGNQELSPEEGWTYEGGIHYGHDKNLFHLSTSLTAYSRMINDWIMWMPPANGINYWSPLNITRVKSRGLETRGSISWKNDLSKITLHTGLDLTWSTFAEPLEEFGIAAGEQLFYVPVENFLTGMSAEFGRWSIYYNHHWFGAANGINDPIQAFNIGDGGLSFRGSGLKFKGSIFIRVENIWDTPYRIIERRPMPGRSFTAGVRFSFF